MNYFKHIINRYRNLSYEKKSINIILLDGIAILLIVLNHQIMDNFGNSQTGFYPEINKYLPIFGLVLFTFSSGYKLSFNHLDDFNNRNFLSKYFIKRFVRLYKPYIIYIILLIPILLIIVNLFNSVGINLMRINLRINDYFSNYNLLLSVFIGNPDMVYAWQLWYLVALIVITAICFVILYYSGTKLLYAFFYPLFLFDILLWIPMQLYSLTLFRIMVYSLIFIFGIYYNHLEKINLNKSKLLNFILSTIFVLIVLLSIISPNFILFKYNIIIYGLTLPCFIILILPYLKRIQYINIFIIFCGIYSFYIYLFHLPLIIPLLDFLIIKLLHINSLLSPIIITILTVFIAMIMYEILKFLKLNKIID